MGLVFSRDPNSRNPRAAEPVLSLKTQFTGPSAVLMQWAHGTYWQDTGNCREMHTPTI